MNGCRASDLPSASDVPPVRLYMNNGEESAGVPTEPSETDEAPNEPTRV